MAIDAKVDPLGKVRELRMIVSGLRYNASCKKNPADGQTDRDIAKELEKDADALEAAHRSNSHE